MHNHSSHPLPQDELLQVGTIGRVSPDEMFSNDRVAAANAMLCATQDTNDEHTSIHKNGASKDILLRLSGLVLLGLAAGALHLLTALRQSGEQALVTLPDYLLALIGIVGACGGSMLLILGRHVLDRVVVSERWQRRD